MLSASPLRYDVSPFGDLARFGSRPALITPQQTVSYLELAARVRATAERLGSTRRLVLLAADNTIDAVVAYLAALAGGHPVLLAPAKPGPHADTLVEAYDPDVVFHDQDGEWQLVERREGTAHDVHPDLALLLSTSGSTGCPKLVRLSRENLRSNAESIATFLGILPTDRAATTLPMHYCYGLSVLNSHLLRGAGVVLTDLSVLDDCFWEQFRAAGATTFAGVPYTFDLLEQCGFADLDLPSLRYVTQAGGRLHPDKVSYWAGLGRRRGWDLYVMYGQTEATARMAYLPPDLALVHPHAIGHAIPGGSFRLEPGTGELVYRGANVMMGYADGPGDLALGATVHELRTGDLARRLPGGLYEIVGRSSRFAKVFGLRIDLDQLERVLDAHDIAARCVEQGQQVHVFVTRYASAAPAQALVVEQSGLPGHAVRATPLQSLPVTANGKPDYAALARQAELLAHDSPPRSGPASAHDLRDLYAELLGRPDATVDSSFVSLGGDSLSYVELSLRLGERLGTLPPGWHTMTLRELVRPAGRPMRRGVRLDTTVLLRAVGILLIVGTHADLFTVYGGAHILLAVAGYNFARFQLGPRERTERLRHGLGAVAQVAVPSMVWIGAVALTSGMYEVETALMLNWLLGSDTWTLQWQFWFLEALVWTVLAAVAVLAVPVVHRAERRSPWAFAVAVLASALLVRYALVGVQAGPVERYSVLVVAWCFALGWAAATADTKGRRLLVSAVAVAAVAGFFGEPQREAIVLAGVLAMLWFSGVTLPRAISQVLAALASASLFIYLTHWQVYPHLEVDHSALAVVSSLAVGLCAERASRPAMRRLAGISARVSARPRTR